MLQQGNHFPMAGHHQGDRSRDADRTTYLVQVARNTGKDHSRGIPPKDSFSTMFRAGVGAQEILSVDRSGQISQNARRNTGMAEWYGVYGNGKPFSSEFHKNLTDINKKSFPAYLFLTNRKYLCPWHGEADHKNDILIF
ncbi:MAG: hypothetical protein U0O39_07780 [Akkermansia sp.]|nr:hypothetical protein [Candidatus Akkermansia timonensis]QWO91478.1 hypothetical protein J5W64_03420 [Candidatus Akkermansia timonensis]QWO93210.1 hypothetical protein J5W56_12070 [Candidatus Akkermansia timonensis]